MFPNSPYPGCSWPLTQHMGVITSRNLYQILFAAVSYREANDPVSEINNYIIINGLLTPNVRADSGQPDAWRDYQQILSELGLIYSTKLRRLITPTPLGLAYLDGSIGYSELITLQALRYQYPNGHKLNIDVSLRAALAGSAFATALQLTELQRMAGVRVRPTVLAWRALKELRALGEGARLTIDEVQNYLMRCSSSNDVSACVQAIVTARHGGVRLPPLRRARRNAQDWIKFWLKTLLFGGRDGAHAYIEQSAYAIQNAADIDATCGALEAEASFWAPRQLDATDRLRWYSFYGTVDLSIPMVQAQQGVTGQDEFAFGREADIPEEEETPYDGGQMSLRPFDAATFLGNAHAQGTGDTIYSAYDASLAHRQHRAHDLMVLLIANACAARGARVHDDPHTVDLLVEYHNLEFIVEVKSVTPLNFVNRLRYALGQVWHYDYLRAQQSQRDRRKVIGLAAAVPPDSWSSQFLNYHLDIDLLSLDGSHLRVDSTSPVAKELFSP